MALEFIADIRFGNIIPPAHVTNFLKHCDGKQGRVILSWGLKKRSLKQNNYFKGIVLPLLTAYFKEGGAKVTEQQVDLLVKKWVDFMRDEEMPDGTVERVPRSTTELDTKAMAEFTEEVIADIAQRFQFYIPLPNERAHT